MVKKQYTAFHAAFTSAFGAPDVGTRGTYNYALTVRFSTLLLRFIREGNHVVKEWCHSVRAIALGDTSRVGKFRRPRFSTPDRLHFASTLGRSLHLPIEKSVVDAAISDCEGRWLSPPPVLQQSLVDSFGRFVRELFQEANERVWKGESDSADCPLPATKACFESNTKCGGVRGHMNNLSQMAIYTRMGDERFQQKLELPLARTLEEARRKQDRDLARRRIRQSYFVPDLTVTLTPFRAYAVSKYFTRMLNEAGVEDVTTPTIPTFMLRPYIKAVAINECGGKVRVASMHPAALSHFTRCIAQRTLPILKRNRAFKRVLRGEQIVIQGADRVYSADLTAASDYISHQLGKVALGAIADGLNLLEDERDALDHAIGPMEITEMMGMPYKKITRMGAHMGLGTTWTVLCLLNLFAANRVAKPNSFAICGDDLIGAWTPDQVAAYEGVMERLGLRINRAKSFYAPRGVFCEHLVRREGGQFRTVHLPKISEALGTKSGMTNDQRHELTQMALPGFIRSVVQRMSRQSNTIAGHPSFGGNGTGHNIELLAAAMARGPVKFLEGDRSAPVKRLVELSKSSGVKVPRSGYIPFKDAMLYTLTQHERHLASNGGRSKVLTRLPEKALRAIYRSRAKLGRSLLNKAASAREANAPRLPKAGSVFADIQALGVLASQSTMLSTRSTRLIKRLTSQPVTNSAKTIRRITNICARSSPGLFVPTRTWLSSLPKICPGHNQRGEVRAGWEKFLTEA